MHRFQHLMVALLNDANDASLLNYAAAVARLSSAKEVRFVHVLPSFGSTDAHDQALRKMKQAVAEDFKEVPREVALAFDVLKGPLTDRLLSHVAEQETDLLLAGHRPGTETRSSLVRRLAMKAPCSIWMVPSGTKPSFGRVLVPVDFSPPSADAMSVAATLVQRLGSGEIFALHVYFNESVVGYEEYEPIIRGQEQAAYKEFITTIPVEGVQVTPLFEQSASVAQVVARVGYSYQADLIVMSTRGRSLSAAILLGSVTDEVLTDCRQPILIVKHQGAALGLLGVLLARDFRSKPMPRYG